ncbi:MAG: arsenate reductase [Pseudomonadota bacterium]|nr:arsenate reductase [Pseudomonadota bacterium]
MIAVYGIKNCDTCRKSLKWLKGEGIEHCYHDLSIDGLDRDSLLVWVESIGWNKLLNRRGTTWRNLPEFEKEGLDETRAVNLMLAHPTLIKRPVFEIGPRVFVGFSAQTQGVLKG